MINSFIFELNNILYQEGLLSEHKYIDEFRFLSFIFMSMIILYISIVYMPTHPKYDDILMQFMPLMITGFIVVVLILLEVYFLLLIVTFLSGVIYIVLIDDRYMKIRTILNKFF